MPIVSDSYFVQFNILCVNSTQPWAIHLLRPHDYEERMCEYRGKYGSGSKRELELLYPPGIIYFLAWDEPEAYSKSPINIPRFHGLALAPPHSPLANENALIFQSMFMFLTHLISFSSMNISCELLILFNLVLL